MVAAVAEVMEVVVEAVVEVAVEAEEEILLHPLPLEDTQEETTNSLANPRTYSPEIGPRRRSS